MSLQEEALKLVVENEMAIVIFLQFLVHKAFSYYALKGRKSFKGFVRFVIGKENEPSA